MTIFVVLTLISLVVIIVGVLVTDNLNERIGAPIAVIGVAGLLVFGLFTLFSNEPNTTTYNTPNVEIVIDENNDILWGDDELWLTSCNKDICYELYVERVMTNVYSLVYIEKTIDSKLVDKVYCNDTDKFHGDMHDLANEFIDDVDYYGLQEAFYDYLD